MRTGSPAAIVPNGSRGHRFTSLTPSTPHISSADMSGRSNSKSEASNLILVNCSNQTGAVLNISVNFSASFRAFHDGRIQFTGYGNSKLSLNAEYIILAACLTHHTSRPYSFVGQFHGAATYAPKRVPKVHRFLVHQILRDRCNCGRVMPSLRPATLDGVFIRYSGSFPRFCQHRQTRSSSALETSLSTFQIRLS